MRSLALFLSLVLVVSGAPPSEVKLDKYTGTPLDLTHPLDLQAQAFPGQRKFEFTRQVAENYVDGKFYSTNEFCMAEHLGTHLDAPYHFNQTNWKVGEIPLGNLITPAVVIDVSEAAAANRDLLLGVDALETWEAQHGRLPLAVTVFFRFGWAAKYHDRAAYLGGNDISSLSFPALSEALAEALVERKAIGVGLDTPSVDSGKTSTTPNVHRILCNANIYILENVDLQTTELNHKIFTLVALPAKIMQGTGAPVRIVAFPDVEDHLPHCQNCW